jgi:tetratricopeptide (TPR) repeat protein
MALFSACAIRVCCGDHAEAEVLAAELRTVTVKYRIAYMGAACTVLEGHTAVARGDTSAGIERMRQALDEFRRQQAGLGWTFAISLPAAACAQLGRAEEGLDLVAEAFEAAERNGDVFLKAELQRLRGDLLHARSPTDLQGPIDCYRQAAALAVEQGARALELRAVASLARLRPTDDEAWLRLRLLYDSFDEGHRTADLTMARALLERAEACTADAR